MATAGNEATYPFISQDLRPDLLTKLATNESYFDSTGVLKNGMAEHLSGTGKEAKDGGEGTGKEAKDGGEGTGKEAKDGGEGTGKEAKDGGEGTGKEAKDGDAGSRDALGKSFPTYDRIADMD